MTRGRQYIEFEGLFSESVLGIFRIIRGFADLRDLAAVSVPYKMEDGEQGFRVVGHQRVESAKHTEEIKNYLEQSENRFLPEVILSVRAPVKLMVNRGEIDPAELGLGRQGHRPTGPRPAQRIPGDERIFVPQSQIYARLCRGLARCRICARGACTIALVSPARPA